jgi:hypothetical protein
MERGGRACYTLGSQNFPGGKEKNNMKDLTRVSDFQAEIQPQKLPNTETK